MQVVLNKEGINSKERKLGLKHKIIILFLSFLIQFPLNGQQITIADYYFDGLNGSDSNNGLTPQTAKQTLDGLASLGSSIAGKTIAFRDSIYYRKTTSGNVAILVVYDNVRITNWYDDASDQYPRICGSYGLTNWTNYSGNIWQMTGTHNNSLVFAYPNSDSLKWGMSRGSIGALTKECDFYKSGSTMYVYSPSDPDARYESVDSYRQTYVIDNYGDHNTFDHLELRYGNGFCFVTEVGSEYITLRDSRVLYTGSSLDVLTGGLSEGVMISGSHVVIANNYIREACQHQITAYAFDSITDIRVDSNVSVNGHYNHFDFNTGGGSISNLKVRYNIAYEEPWAEYRQEPGYTSLNGGFWTNGAVQDAEIAYNLVYDLVDARIYDCRVGAMTVNNNTFVQSRPGNTELIIYSDGGAGSVFKNNIFYAATGGSIGGLPSGSTNNITSNPSFVDFQTTDFSKRNFHLTGGSNAVNYGTDLGYTKDLDGNPIIGNPDAGAYEFTGGGGGENDPPNQPSNPFPTNGAIDQPVNLTISWSCTDPDGDPLTFDVYFGTSNNPPLASSNQPNASFNPGSLDTSTTYYWQIVAKDNQGASTTGPVWNFTTEANRGGDITPPEVVSATLIDSNTVNIIFSEPIEQSGAQNENNYSINNGITVLSASLSGSEVTLNTSDHSPGTYTLTVNNVADLAGNLIDPNNNSAEYERVGNTTLTMINIVEATASVIPEPEHHPGKTIDGMGYYQGDPDSRWAGDTMPEWIMFDLGAVENIGLIKLSFYNWNSGRIYTSSVDASNNLTQWTEVLSNATSSSTEWTENAFSNIDARYIRVSFISSNENGWAGLWETEIWGPNTTPIEEEMSLPDGFKLEQNYPNPFNPTTKIKFSIPQSGKTTLKVFNLLGNVVATLIDDNLSAGTFEVDFNANNISSGVYFYTLQTGAFVETKKMILLK